MVVDRPSPHSDRSFSYDTTTAAASVASTSLSAASRQSSAERTPSPKPTGSGAPRAIVRRVPPPPVYGAAAIRMFLRSDVQDWTLGDSTYEGRPVWVASRDVDTVDETAFARPDAPEGPLTVECSIDKETGLVLRWALSVGRPRGVGGPPR